MLRKFSLPHRDLNWLSVSNRLQKEGRSETCLSVWQRKCCSYARELGKEWVWLRGLRKHHKSLYLRKSEAVSHTQAESFNCENVKAFFENYCEFHLSVWAISVAKENGIVLFTLAPHVWHTAFFGPYKTYRNWCLNVWMPSNAGKPVTIYSVVGIIRQCFS